MLGADKVMQLHQLQLTQVYGQVRPCSISSRCRAPTILRGQLQHSLLSSTSTAASIFSRLPAHRNATAAQATVSNQVSNSMQPSCMSMRTAQHQRGHLVKIGAAAGRGIPAQRSVDEAAPARPLKPGAMRFGSSSAQGLRDTMEDDVAIVYDAKKDQLFAGVFDGHGGCIAAKWLSAELHKLIGTAFDASTLTAGFVKADKELIAHLRKVGSLEEAQAGSTATVAIFRPGGKLVVANVGDSEAVLSRNGVPVSLGEQHRVYGKKPGVAEETKRIEEAGGWVDDGRVCGVLAVSRAFGDGEFKGDGLPSLMQTGVERGYWNKEFAAQQSFTADPVLVTPAVQAVTLTKDDEFLVVATDGLWDVLSPLEAVKWARKEFKTGATPDEVAARMVTMALSRYSSDNIAVVVIDLAGPDHWDPAKKAGSQARKPMFGGMFSSSK